MITTGPGFSSGEAVSETDELAEPIRQLDSHRKLVSQAERGELDTGLTLDAIIVPASRPANNLEQAITLARGMRCELLILCSRQVQPADVRQLLRRRSFDDAIVVNLPDNYRHELLEFSALDSIKNRLPDACSAHVTDLSTKRNVGLLLARMLGWQRIFFLDDDIRDVRDADLQQTISTLGPFPVAGMRVSNFPDNSVACHAHRMTGGLQDVFVSGAALAVDCQKITGFFPDVYNEDWLFFYEAAARRRLGSSGRKVTQLLYDPFADPQRAAWQEFGDVLAEGLYALLEYGQDWQYATDEYWKQFLDARRRFLEAIASRAGTVAPEIRERLALSVELALKCSYTIGAGLLERYVLLWRQDLRQWQERIAGVREVPLETALKELGLAEPPDAAVSDFALDMAMETTEGPPTIPFTAPDYYTLFMPSAHDDGLRPPERERAGGRRIRRPGFLPHRESLVTREGGRFAAARPARRMSEREDAPAEPSESPSAPPGEPAVEPACG
jgi:hypothetical protein